MNPNVVTIARGAMIAEAFRIMIEKKTNGLVVLSPDEKVAGILSSRDLISYVIPDYLEDDRHLASFESDDVLIKRVKRVGGDDIEKCMTAKVYTIKSDRSLMEAATLLSQYKIRQLPVTDDAGNLKGYINRTDIKRAIGDILGIPS